MSIPDYKMHNVALMYREKKKTPFMVRFGLSTACNYNCSMCCGVHSPYMDHSVPLEYINTEILLKTLQYLYENGTQIILFSGVGEPFAHKDIYGILEYCSDKFIIYFQTNASLIDIEKVSQMNFSKLLSLSVNFNAVSEKSYKLIYGNQPYSNLKKIISKIQKLKQQEVDIKLIFIVSIFNYKDVTATLILAEKLGVRVHLEFSNEFQGQEGIIYLPKQKKQQVIEEFKLYMKTHPHMKNFINVEEFIIQGSGERTAVRNFSKCNVGYMYMRVEESGEVYPCNSVQHKEYYMGNINESSLQEIWESKQYKEFREDVFIGKLHGKCCHKNENTLGANYKIRRFIDQESSLDSTLEEKEVVYKKFDFS